MKKLFRGFVLLVAVLVIQLTFLPANEAYANENPLTFSKLNVQIMPEFINPEEWDYTIPSLLVGYHGSIVNETEEPYDGEIIFKLPTNLPQFQIGYLAQEVDEQQHLPIDFTINEEEQYISLTPQEPIAPNATFDFIIEHFSASIEGGVERDFTFKYVTDAGVTDFNVAIYAPFRAENFQVEQEATLVSDSFGGEVYVYEMGEVNQGETIAFDVSYTKDSNVTTLEAFNDMQGGMPDDDIHAGLNEGGQAQGGNNSFISTEDAVLISLTIIIVGAFIFVIVRKKKNGDVVSKEASAKPKKIINKEEEIKKLRKMLAEGKIDEKTYKEKRSKLG
ncbi:hypothetical protein BKP35_04530 [Anaerobacillus arseniciselenatis]|uniref:Uncharacterized protein n=1 Tax=Anaerobacillus arseniciselenatis TaxID=85682 RepID=A0A1S2LVP4_9BACI|nr:hypothetical protein [Anaerobacillus arseniciselenatis]OIJ16243.1 hypothetical protein BKP35_04530 [Anaerobacillus arseniciselenatis]